MPNWLATRRAVKRVGKLNGIELDPIVDRIIDASSRRFERETRRRFIPTTETRLYRWPPLQRSRSYVLWLDEDLLSVSALLTQAQDTTPTPIDAADFFIEDVNLGPPFSRIEIDLSSTSVFEPGDTQQRAISVAGDWGFGEDTVAAGALADVGGIDAAVTTLDVSDGSRVDVGHTLLIETERIFVEEQSFVAPASAALIDGALGANKNNVSVTLDAAHGVLAGEVMLLDAEQILAEVVVGNVLTIQRAINGSTLAAHIDDTPVNVNRRLTIVRGLNGSTAAIHADTTAIARYAPPADVVEIVTMESLGAIQQELSSMGRTIGPGDRAFEFKGRDLSERWDRVMLYYRRVREAAI